MLGFYAQKMLLQQMIAVCNYPVVFLIPMVFLLCDMPLNMQMQNPECSVMVDNCYGEFVESIEPPMVVCDNNVPHTLLLYSKSV